MFLTSHKDAVRRHLSDLTGAQFVQRVPNGLKHSLSAAIRKESPVSLHEIHTNQSRRNTESLQFYTVKAKHSRPHSEALQAECICRQMKIESTPEIKENDIKVTQDFLPDPEILEAVKHVIPWEALEKGLHFKIPKFENMAGHIHFQLIGAGNTGRAYAFTHTGDDRDVVIALPVEDFLGLKGPARAVYLKDLEVPPRQSQFISYTVTSRP